MGSSSLLSFPTYSIMSALASSLAPNVLNSCLPASAVYENHKGGTLWRAVWLCSLCSTGILIIRSSGITESFPFTEYCQKQIWKLGWASFWVFYFFSKGILWTLRSSSLLNSGTDLTLYSFELHLLPRNQICLNTVSCASLVCTCSSCHLTQHPNTCPWPSSFHYLVI